MDLDEWTMLNISNDNLPYLVEIKVKWTPTFQGSGLISLMSKETNLKTLLVNVIIFQELYARNDIYTKQLKFDRTENHMSNSLLMECKI